MTWKRRTRKRKRSGKRRKSDMTLSGGGNQIFRDPKDNMQNVKKGSIIRALSFPMRGLLQ